MRHHDATQVKRVLAFLKAGHSIESMEAIRRFGCTRLASVIDDLRRAGHPIITDMIKFKAQSGITSRFARYFLPQEGTRKLVGKDENGQDKYVRLTRSTTGHWWWIKD